MPCERVLLVSDVHLDEWKDDLPGDYQEKHQAFLSFLGWVAQMGTAGKIGRFVIAGDLIDVPQNDRSPLLPTYDDVFEGIKTILAAGVKFGYVIGNHDSGMVGLSLDLAHPEICVGYPYILVKSADAEFVVEQRSSIRSLAVGLCPPVGDRHVDRQRRAEWCARSVAGRWAGCASALRRRREINGRD